MFVMFGERGFDRGGQDPKLSDVDHHEQYKASLPDRRAAALPRASAGREILGLEPFLRLSCFFSGVLVRQVIKLFHRFSLFRLPRPRRFEFPDRCVPADVAEDRKAHCPSRHQSRLRGKGIRYGFVPLQSKPGMSNAYISARRHDIFRQLFE